MKRYKPENNVCVTEYASLSEFLTEINSLPNNKYMTNIEASQRIYSSDDNWSGTSDYRRACYLINNGWDAAAEKMTTKVKLTHGAQSPVKTSKPVFSVVGSQASVPRYLQGIPTNMVSRQMTYNKQKVVTITKGISYSAMYSAEKIMNESVKALQIIQAMENGGQRVRLNVMIASTNYKDQSSVCKVCIKQPDERMNISKMAFALAHPSMLRRFFFKWFEVDPFIDFNLGGSFGSPSSQRIKNLVMSDNEYYIPEDIDDIQKVIEQIQNGKTKA